MPVHAGMRVAAIALVAVIFSGGRPALWEKWVYSVAFGHYFLSILYARSRIGGLFRQPESAVPFLVVAVLGTFFYATNFSLLVFFAAHHVFNEAYLAYCAPGVKEGPGRGRLLTAALFYNLFLYFAVLRSAPDLLGLPPSDWFGWMNRPFLPKGWWFGGLLIAGVFFFVELWRARPRFPEGFLFDRLLFEILGLAILAASFFTPIRLLHVIGYHVLFWCFYPLPRMLKQGAGGVAVYLGLTVVLTAAAFALAPRLAEDPRLHFPDGWFKSQFFLWSYLHIASAFVLSNAHPSWITRWFRPRPAAAAAG